MYTCMLNRSGGTEADLTVSVLENGDNSTVVQPKFEGRIMSLHSSEASATCA